MLFYNYKNHFKEIQINNKLNNSFKIQTTLLNKMMLIKGDKYCKRR